MRYVSFFYFFVMWASLCIELGDLLLVVLKYSDTNYILKYNIPTMLLLFSTHFRLV